MTMSINAPVTLDVSSVGQAWSSMTAHIAAALRAAHARREARHAYRWLLRCGDDHLLRDVGLTGADLRATIRELEGRS